jgi:hypothetical protein
MTFRFPKKIPKAWIEVIERNGRVDSEVHGLKVVGKDKRGIIVKTGKDSFKILHNGKNQNVFGNPLVGSVGLDPNFGYETLVTWTQSIENNILGSLFTMNAEEGTADSITVGLKTGDAWTGKIKCAIYLHSTLARVGVTDERTITLTTTATWYTFVFSGTKPSLTASTAYILVVWGQSATGTAYVVYNDGAANQGHPQSLTYNGFPNPLVPDYHTSDRLSIYCTYTAEGVAGKMLVQVI